MVAKVVNILQSTKKISIYVAVSTQMLQILCFFIVFSCFILRFQFLSLFLQRETKYLKLWQLLQQTNFGLT